MGDDSWAFVGLGRSGFQSKKPVGLEDQWESWSKNGLILAAEHKEASAQGRGSTQEWCDGALLPRGRRGQRRHRFAWGSPSTSGSSAAWLLLY